MHVQKQASTEITHDRIVHQIELLPFVRRTLCGISYDAGIFRIRSLLNYIANEVGPSAVWNIDLIARATRFFIHDLVVEDKVCAGSRFDVMAVARVVDVTELERKFPDVSHVYIVVVIAVATRKLRTFN